MRNAGLEETQAGIKIAGRNINNLRYADKSEVIQLCLTLSYLMDCSVRGSSIHEIFQARVLEQVAISFSRGSFQPRDQTQVPPIVGRCFTVWASEEVLYADDTTLMAKSEEELQSLLMKVKEESEEVGLKLNIQETKIMASGPITSWEIDGETVETVSDFIFLASKITADGDCSHEIKRHLLLGRKAMTKLDSILKSKEVIFQTGSV